MVLGMEVDLSDKFTSLQCVLHISNIKIVVSVDCVLQLLCTNLIALV